MAFSCIGLVENGLFKVTQDNEDAGEDGDDDHRASNTVTFRCVFMLQMEEATTSCSPAFLVLTNIWARVKGDQAVKK